MPGRADRAVGITYGFMSMVQMQLSDVWSTAGVIVGFQVAAFTLRINREVAVGDQGRVTWLPPADYLNLVSLAFTLGGVFIAPVIGAYDEVTAAKALGVSLVLLACYPFALAGHYELFHTKGRTFRRFPGQEKVAIAVTVGAVVAYILLATLR